MKNELKNFVKKWGADYESERRNIYISFDASNGI